MAKRKGDAKKTQDLENQLKRALADYSNLQKRVEQEKDQVIDFARAAVVTRLFNTLDILEAVEKADGKRDLGSIKRGIEIALKEFKNALSNLGVEEIEAGSTFDPEIHEAVEVVKGEEDNKVVEVVTKGYRMGDRVLRATRVKVSKKDINSK